MQMFVDTPHCRLFSDIRNVFGCSVKKSREKSAFIIHFLTEKSFNEATLCRRFIYVAKSVFD